MNESCISVSWRTVDPAVAKVVGNLYKCDSSQITWKEITLRRSMLPDPNLPVMVSADMSSFSNLPQSAIDEIRRDINESGGIVFGGSVEEWNPSP